MDNHVINEFYNTLRIQARQCLYPGMSCSNTPINAHSIQNSSVFEILNFEGHLIGLKIKPTKHHYPDLIFDKIGKNKASTFEGFCSKHDKELFEEIDDHQFDRNNKKQLFLLAYRSVSKELHASMSKAIKIQTAYLSKVQRGSIDGNSISEEGLFATQCIIDAYEVYEYKNELDKALLNKNLEVLAHRIFEIELENPKLACSQLFSNDSVIYKNSVSRIIMNIFPINKHQTLAIFSSTSGEKKIADNYLYKCIQSHGQLRNYEISKMIIRNSENFFINPSHFETWSIEKKNKILKYFLDTMYVDIDRDDTDYYLF
jgi:hypothetical protein